MSIHTLPPDGECLFPLIWRQDPASSLLKSITVTATIAGLIAVFFYPIILVEVGGLDDSWDKDHGITIDTLTSDVYRMPWMHIMFRMIEETMGLPVGVSRKLLTITIGLLLALVAWDCMPWNGCTQEPWPKRWNVDNMICYEEMFLEPTRLGRFLRRPGNALSNFIYFYGASCVLLSALRTFLNPVAESIFVLADVLFGIMLLLLSISSTIWHASNAPDSHYVDLWTMDCCIAFLNIRVVSLGLACLFIQHVGTDPATAKFRSGWVCTGIFLCFIFLNGRHYYRNWKSRSLHGPCTFSSRARLSNKSDLFGKGHFPLTINSACVFTGLPILSVVLPSIVQYTFVGSTGSVLALTATQVSFVCGWCYRVFEKFALDGCIPMNFICRQDPSTVRTVGAALFSPTAVLHVTTGITLLMAYIHARSVEQCIF